MFFFLLSLVKIDFEVFGKVSAVPETKLERVNPQIMNKRTEL